MTNIADQVVEFYDDLFRHVFTNRVAATITAALRRRAVDRSICEAADAASQSLTRFFLNQAGDRRAGADRSQRIVPPEQLG